MTSLPQSQIGEIGDRIQVSVEYIDWLNAERKKINGIHLSKIDLFENGEKLNIPEDVINRFLFTGLSNIDFVTCSFYDVNGDLDSAIIHTIAIHASEDQKNNKAAWCEQAAFCDYDWRATISA